MNEDIKLHIIGQMQGGYERINRVYATDGIAPCMTSRDYKDPPRILITIKNDERKNKT